MTPLLEVLGVLSERTGIEGSLILQFLEMILESRVDHQPHLESVLSTQYRYFVWGVVRASTDYHGSQYRHLKVGNISTRTVIEKLKLGYTIAPIAATSVPSIACENSH